MPRALNIAFDARHYGDFGFGTYIRNLIGALAEIDRTNQYRLIAKLGDVERLKDLPPNFKAIPYPRADNDPADNIAFPLFLRKPRPDLTHIPLNSVPVFMPKPYVVTIHDLSSLLFNQSTEWKAQLHTYRFRRGLTRASRVIAVSGSTQRDVENIVGVPSSRIRRIYNAIDPKFQVCEPIRGGGPQDTKKEVRETLERFSITYPYILYAGTIRPQKNIARLVEAFAVVRGELENHPKYKDLRLLIIGDEISKHPEIRREVIRTRTQQTVRFLGFVEIETLRVFYESAEAFVFPSLYEGFGLPPLEAMSSGTPVITSSVSSLPEVVGDAAMIVNPENVFDIARGIKEVLLDPMLRSSLIEKGYERLSMFRWRHTAQQVLEVYQEAAGG